MRERARAEGRPPRYDGNWRDRDPAEGPPGVPPAIRLRAPREGETVVRDLVQGEVRVANAELDDMILLRSDGTPTFQHAVVVDDHDMAISHVIRGDDHFTNTFRQVALYRALDWALPAFAHIPLIHGADGAKLSKRHGAVSVLEFREQGFLPEALCNYLLRLGWGHGDEEVISREAAIRLFDLDGVGRAPSRMDYAKLTHLNGVWLRAADDERLTAEVLARLGAASEGVAAARIRALMPGLKERARTLVELAELAAFLLPGPPPAPDPKAAALLSGEARAMLRDLAAGAGRDRFFRARARCRAARLRDAIGPKTRPGRPAAARGADRAGRKPGDRRDARGPRARGGSRADRGGGRVAKPTRRRHTASLQSARNRA